jgi:hypothetical protein
MKVFISWSGQRSKLIAEALREWLPLVIQSLQPWMSAADIDKGAKWSTEISRELEQADFGVSCVTPENLNEPWLLFEAGALSKKDGARVCTYLWELEAAAVPQPLGQFQATKCNKADTERLVGNMKEFRRDLARAVRWHFYRREPGEPSIKLYLNVAQFLIARLEEFAEKRDDVGAEALVNAGAVADPWHEPIVRLGRAVGMPNHEALVFAKDLEARGIVRIVPAYMSLQAPGEQSFGKFERWERSEERSPVPEQEGELMENKELDVQVQRRILRSDIGAVPDYSSSLVDFQLLYEHIQQNWTYRQKMEFRSELEARLKRSLPTQPDVFPQWSDLMSLEAGSLLPMAGCEAALTVQGSETGHMAGNQ